MLKFLNLQPEIFGLDINDLSLKIVKLRKERGGFKLVSLNEVPVRPGIVKEGAIRDKEGLANIIKFAVNTVKGEKLANNYMVMSLPEEKSFSQVIQMPKMTEKELRSAVPFEAENYIPLTIDKVYWDFQVIDSHKDGETNHVDLLINVMPKPIVDAYVYSAKKAGLVPYILEVESQAIVSALVKEKQIIPPTIFIDLGQDNTSFIIFSGGSIRFTSSLSVYSGQMTQTISDKLKVNLKEAEQLKIKCGLLPGKEKKYNLKECLDPILYNLADEIKRYISFYKGHVSHEYFSSDKKIEKVILSGGGANLKGLPEFLFNELKIPIEFGNPFINMEVQRGRGLKIPPQRALSFTTAIGLALRGANDENS